MRVRGTMYYVIEVMNMADDTQMMKGILEGCILALLKKEAAHGYRVVERLSAWGFDTTEATVYPILNRLEKKGDLAFTKEPSSIGPPRKVYALTSRGERSLREFEANWTATSRIVGRLLKEESI